MTRPLFAFVVALLVFNSSNLKAEITGEHRQQLGQVAGLVRQAGAQYVAGDYDQSAQSIAVALKTAKALIATEDKEVLDALKPDYMRMRKAYELLKAKGVALPTTDTATGDVSTQSEPEPEPDAGVSFTKQVVPIVLSHCGRCHVEQAKGRYSAKTFASLIKGSRKGKAVVPGEPDKSRLVTLIKSGKMPPRSRGIPRQQLATLEDWIHEGAKFDGDDDKADVRKLKPARG